MDNSKFDLLKNRGVIFVAMEQHTLSRVSRSRSFTFSSVLLFVTACSIATIQARKFCEHTSQRSFNTPVVLKADSVAKSVICGRAWASDVVDRWTFSSDWGLLRRACNSIASRNVVNYCQLIRADLSP